MQVIDRMDLISITGFLQGLNISCDSNVIHEGAAIWMFQYFMRRSAAGVFAACLFPNANDSYYIVRKQVIKKYFQMVSHLLETYATDYIMAKMDGKISCYLKLLNTSQLGLANELRLKIVLEPKRLWDYVLKGIFV